MAEKIGNTIGRELRYFEYKFLKKQSKKGKKGKNIPDGQLAWSDSSTTDDFRFTPKNEEVQKAMPGSKGEEELQVQVALAMSREEEHERSRRTESDKIRLEMALKESKNDNNSTPATQPSLLDMSMRGPRSVAAPRPVAAPMSSFDATDAFGAPVTNDPWGGATASAVPAPAPTFDPFTSQQPNNVQANVQTSNYTATNAFGPTNDAWGLPQTSPAVAAPSSDPWGGAQSFPPQPTPIPQNTFQITQATNVQSFQVQPQLTQNSFPTPQPSNPWGNATPDLFDTPLQATAPTQNAFPIQQNGAWGDQNAFPKAQTHQDPFGYSTSTTVPVTTQVQNNAFGMLPSTDFTAPPFDPLHEFDSLHIGSEPAPVLLQNDFGNGKSVARDIFPLSQVLEPEPLIATQSYGENALPMTTKKETEMFLGKNSSLVNLDTSGWTSYTKTPYCTKPLGSASHNPFQQSGPSRSLNEMKSVNQPRFA